MPLLSRRHGALVSCIDFVLTAVVSLSNDQNRSARKLHLPLTFFNLGWSRSDWEEQILTGESPARGLSGAAAPGRTAVGPWRALTGIELHLFSFGAQ